MEIINSGKRLGQYLEKQHKTAYWLETECGLKNGRIKKAIDRNTVLKREIVNLILPKLPKLSRNWLEEGVGPEEIETLETNTNTNKPSSYKKGSIERENELLEEIRQLHKKNIELAVELAKTEKQRDSLKEENDRLKEQIKKSA